MLSRPGLRQNAPALVAPAGRGAAAGGPLHPLGAAMQRPAVGQAPLGRPAFLADKAARTGPVPHAALAAVALHPPVSALSSPLRPFFGSAGMRGQGAMAAPVRVPAGLVASGLAHAGAVLWVALGGLFLAADAPPQIAGVEVSLISGAAFDALMARSDGGAAPYPAPFADHQPVPGLAPEVQAAIPPATDSTLRPVTPAPSAPLAAATVTPAAPTTVAKPVASTAPTQLARAPLLAPVGASPSLPHANVVSALEPQSGALAPVRAMPAAAPAPTTLHPLPDLPPAQEAGPDTPRPRPRPAPEDRQVAEAAPPAPRQAAPQKAAPAAPKKASAKPADTPAAATNGDQSVNNRRGAAEGAADGAAVDGKAGAKGKVAGNAKASNYGGQVLRKISRTKKPKAPARGTVVVGFTIADSGGLAGVQVLRSSGASALDAVALDHIRRAAPFPAPPEGARRSFSFEFVGRP
jgi:protein TonB